jgi:hypothetical protein
MIIRNLANKVSFPSTPLGVTCQAERSRGHLAYKTEHLSLETITCKKADIQLIF